MSYTHEQLAALKAAFAKGLKSVSYDGRSVTYSSQKEMHDTIKIMERELNGTKSRANYPTFERGT